MIPPTRSRPKVGDLVQIAEFPNHESPLHAGKVGIVSDVLAMSDGWYQYEIIFDNDRGWYDTLQFSVVTENETR